MVGEQASDVSEAAARKAQDVKEAAVEAAARNAEEAKEKVAPKAQQAKDKATDKAHQSREEMAHKAQQGKEKVKDKAHEARDEMAHNTQRMWEAAKRGTWREVISPVKTGSKIGVAGVATASGTCMWVTFASSYVLATVLGRQQYGVVHSKIYPVCFKAMSVSILAGLARHVLARRMRLLADAAEMWQTLNLLATLLMVEAKASFLEPRATKAMFERMKAEKEEGRGRDSSVTDVGTEAEPAAAARTGGQAALENLEQEAVRLRITKLGDRLRRLNSYSSCLNILTLTSLTWHLVCLAQRLSLDC